MSTMTSPTSTDLAQLDEIPERPERTLDIAGREVWIRSLSDSQIAQMNHETMILESDRYDVERKRKALDRVYRALYSMFVHQEDRDLVAELMADGEVDIRVLMKEAIAGMKQDAEAKAPQVRRGRTPRRR